MVYEIFSEKYLTNQHVIGTTFFLYLDHCKPQRREKSAPHHPTYIAALSHIIEDGDSGPIAKKRILHLFRGLRSELGKEVAN
jgi:hypothetical protein